MKVAVFLFTLLFFSSIAAAQRCVSPSTPTSDETHWGGNEVIRMREEESISRLRGRVEAPDGTPLYEALVEVFAGEKRIIACRVSDNASFDIAGIKKGQYELRVSWGAVFNVSVIDVSVNPRVRDKRKLVVTLGLGT